MMIRHFVKQPIVYLGFFFTVCFPHSLLADVDSSWRAEELEQYVVEPGKDEWVEIESIPCRENIAYSISDVTGKEVSSGNIISKDCILKIKLNLNKGYYHLNINGLVRGIYSTPTKVLTDFFGVDAALTHIIKDEGLRSEYVSLLKRIGIKVVRERLIWGDLSPESGVWNGASKVDDLRKEYKKSDIKVLEAVQVSLQKGNEFPAQDKIEKDFTAFYDRWGKGWIGIEPWNEPNNRNTTSKLNDDEENKYIDKYVTYTKQSASVIKDNVRVVNGSLAGNLGANAGFSKKLSLREDFFATKSDFSFHTYGEARNLSKWLAEYKNWLREKNFSGEIWITESGWAVHDDDLQKVSSENISVAVQIAAKAIVAYSSNVKHYFAFVLPFYEEKDGKGKIRYFGLTDKSGSPNLSLAAYIQAAQVLSSSHHSDVKILTSERGFKTFIPSDDHIVVAIYNNSGDTIPIPASVSYVEGMDGRKIDLESNDLLLGEGIVYLYFSNKNRSAAKLYFTKFLP